MARGGDSLSVEPARSVDRYRILAPIASGGMAVVYLAAQTGLGGFGRHVALKLVHAHLREDPQWAAALVEEAKLAARVQHPNVVQTLDVGQAPEGVFLVMEYVEGDTLAALIRHATGEAEGIVPLAVALRILVDFLAGLHAAHEVSDDTGRHIGLVHRDVSPQNVIVGVDGMARLADFGIAKASGRAGVTKTGTLKGKCAFMSPEQVHGRPLDRRCDVWAAGIVAWELLVGRRLYSGLEEAQILFRVVSVQPPAPRTLRPSLPPEIDEVVRFALQLDPGARCPTAQQFREELLAGAAAAGITLATHDEVGHFVRQSAGGRLEALRRAAREAKEGAGAFSQVSGVRPALATEPAEGGTQTTLVTDTRKKLRSVRTRFMPLVAVAVISGGLALVAGLRMGGSRAPEASTPLLPEARDTPSSAGAAASTVDGAFADGGSRSPVASVASAAPVPVPPPPPVERVPARGRRWRPPAAPSPAVANSSKILGNPY